MKRFLFYIAAALAVLSCGKDQKPKDGGFRPSSVPLVTIDPYINCWSASDRLYDSSPQHWTGKDFPLLGIITVDGTDYRFLGAESAEYELISPNFPTPRWEGETSYERSFWLDDTTGRYLLLASANDGGEFVLNGTEIFRTERSRENLPVEIPSSALKEGTNVLQAHGWNKIGRAILGSGIIREIPQDFPYPQTAEQQGLRLEAMNTYYYFTAGSVALEVRFTAPLFLEDLSLVSRPVNYVSFNFRSLDDRDHEVSLRFGCSPRWCVDNSYDDYVTGRMEKGRLKYLTAASTAQMVLEKAGDDVRIDWGCLVLAAPKLWEECKTSGNYLSFERDFGAAKKGGDLLMIGYDDRYSVSYFDTPLRPYWNRSGDRTIEDEFEAAYRDRRKLLSRSKVYDTFLRKDAVRKGGPHYADLLAAAFRQSITAHKLVESPSGNLLWLSKENNSNGSIGTVDVAYPAMPLFLKYGPELAKGLLNPIYEYSEKYGWDKPFAAHDLGTYPIASGQTYPYDMPVEESGNMILLTAAVALYNGDLDYARTHWETMSRWAEYLSEFGYDPADQLCTDDFAGRLAHNVNLSVKAILALASYGKMAEKLGFADVAEKYGTMVKEMAQKWQEMAFDGDHYRLTFDRPGSWSQKYNLVWDRILGLDVFPEEVIETELSYYLTVQNEYGLPLDSRESYTKIDWILWTASMAKDNETFMKFVEPVWKFENETPDRVPMGDWVWTQTPRWQAMKARSVVGGLFIRLL